MIAGSQIECNLQKLPEMLRGITKIGRRKGGNTAFHRLPVRILGLRTAAHRQGRRRRQGGRYRSNTALHRLPERILELRTAAHRQGRRRRQGDR